MNIFKIDLSFFLYLYLCLVNKIHVEKFYRYIITKYTNRLKETIAKKIA